MEKFTNLKLNEDIETPVDHALKPDVDMGGWMAKSGPVPQYALGAVNPNNIIGKGVGMVEITAEIGPTTKSEPAKFVSKIFESRQMAHVYHLKVKGDEGSYAAHKALESYYEDILELIDSFVEVYAGQYDIIEDYELIDTSSTKTKEKIEYFIELSEFIKNTRYAAILKEDTHLQNIIDNMVELTYKTIYKLKYNK